MTFTERYQAFTAKADEAGYVWDQEFGSDALYLAAKNGEWVQAAEYHQPYYVSGGVYVSDPQSVEGLMGDEPEYAGKWLVGPVDADGTPLGDPPGAAETYLDTEAEAVVTAFAMLALLDGGKP